MQSIPHHRENQVQFGRVPYDVIASGVVCNLNANDCRVYLILLAHANRDWECRISIATLKHLAGCSERTAQRTIARLQEFDLISVQPGGGRQRTNIYTIAKKPRHADDTLSNGNPVKIEQKPRHADDTLSNGNPVTEVTPFEEKTPSKSNGNPVKIEQKPRHPGDGGTELTELTDSSSNARARAREGGTVATLRAAGLSAAAAAQFVQEHGEERCTGAAAVLHRKLAAGEPVRNPAGLVRSLITSGGWTEGLEPVAEPTQTRGSPQELKAAVFRALRAVGCPCRPAAEAEPNNNFVIFEVARDPRRAAEIFLTDPPWEPPAGEDPTEAAARALRCDRARDGPAVDCHLKDDRIARSQST